MDLENILSGLIGAIFSGGGLTWIFLARENKAKSKADVADSSSVAMNKMLILIGDQQEKFNKIISDKDKIIEQQRELIDKYKVSLDEANKKINELIYRIADNERKITGMQKVIDGYAVTTKNVKNG